MPSSGIEARTTGPNEPRASLHKSKTYRKNKNKDKRNKIKIKTFMKAHIKPEVSSLGQNVKTIKTFALMLC